MATVTDFDGSQNSVVDYNSVGIPEDSNVNVFEFGNLILADVLPSILWAITYVYDFSGSLSTAVDYDGNLLSVTDSSLDNSFTYDYNDTYDDTTTNYDGYPLQGFVIDINGS